jgi:hypothetical protein
MAPHACRSASIGSSRAARRAGKQPKTMPPAVGGWRLQTHTPLPFADPRTARTIDFAQSDVAEEFVYSLSLIC